MASTRTPRQRGRTQLLGALLGAAALLVLSACDLSSGSSGLRAAAAEPAPVPGSEPARPAPESSAAAAATDDGAVEAEPRPPSSAMPRIRRALTEAAAPAKKPAVAKAAPTWQRGVTLQRGARGPMVVALQRRLSELGYDPGMHDGSLGTKTRQALWAFQHINNMPAHGEVDAATSARLSAPRAPVPFAAKSGPTRVEVDIARQVAVVYLNGSVRLITHVSSGSGRKWCEMDRGRLRCASGNTPRGTFRVHNEINGWRTSYLGKLYQPAYFRGGYALHGSLSVPNHPASHGCVRIPMHVAEYLIDLTRVGMPVIVI